MTLTASGQWTQAGYMLKGSGKIGQRDVQLLDDFKEIVT
jgi:hypothetical protein